MPKSTRPGGPSPRPRRTSTSRPGSAASRPRSGSRPGPRTGSTSGSRTATRRPPTGRAHDTKVTTQQRPRSLRRLVIVGVLVTFLAVILAPTVRAYIHQRGQISALEQQIAQQKSNVSSLQQEKERWKDPAYVEQQARERLKFVKPGEKEYTTITGDGQDEATAPESGIAAVPDDVKSHRPWYGEVWESVRIADSGVTSPSPSVAPRHPASKQPEPPAVRDTQRPSPSGK